MKKSKFLKFYQVDLWGTFFRRLRNFKGLPVFFARIRKGRTLRVIEVNPAKLRRKPLTTQGRLFMVKQCFKNFSSNWDEKRLRRFVRSLKKKHRPMLRKTNSICSDHYESRLDIILYRLNVFSSPRAIRQFIKQKNVIVNGNIIVNPHYRCRRGDLITFLPRYRALLFKKHKLDLKRFRRMKKKTRYIYLFTTSYLLSLRTNLRLKDVNSLTYKYMGPGLAHSTWPFRMSWQLLLAYYRMLK